MYRDSYTCTHMQIYRYIHDSIQTYMSPCTCIYIHVSLSICTCIAGASLHANMYIVCMYACKPACTNKYDISSAAETSWANTPTSTACPSPLHSNANAC